MTTRTKQRRGRANWAFASTSGLWVMGMSFVLALWTNLASAQSGRYEVSVSWGSSASLITSSYEVTAGKAIEVPVGEEFVSIVVLPLSDGEYDLQISQLSKESDTRLPTAVFTRRETFGTRSELKDTASGVSIQDGATVAVLKLAE